MKKLDAPLIYYISEFFTGLSFRVVIITSVIYRLNVVGLDPLQLVLVGTTLEATAFIFEVPTGVVADAYSRRLSTIIGMFVIGIGFMVEGLAPLFPLVLLSQVVWGLGWTFVSGAHSAWITDEVGVDKVGPIFLRGGQISLIGSLVAIPVSVWAANHSLALPFFIGGTLLIILGIFLILFMPETGFKRAPKEERQTWRAMFSTVRQGFAHMRGSRALMAYVFIELFVGLYSEGWDRLSSAHLLENFAFPAVGSLNLSSVDWFGIISFITVIFGLVANELARRRLDTASSNRLAKSLQYFYTLMVICMVVFSMNGNFYLALVMMLTFNTLRGVTFPLTETWLNQHIKSEVRATVLSMTSQLDALGQMIGGPIIGTIGRIRSIRTAILSASIILSPTVLLYSRAAKNNGKKSSPKESISV